MKVRIERLVNRFWCNVTLRSCEDRMVDIEGGKHSGKCGKDFINPVPVNHDNSRVSQGMATCIKSGQLIFTNKLSDSAIREILGG